jgi:ABC-type multidrug transport system fused ATPase/permease subunit
MKEETAVKNESKRELHTLKFFIHRIWNASPSYVCAATIDSLLEAALPFVGILLPKYMIDEMLGLKRTHVLTRYVLIAAFSALILTIASSALKRYMKVLTNDILLQFEYDIGKRNMCVEYKYLEDVKYIEQKDKAMLPIRDRMTHLFMVRYLPDMVRYFFTAVGAVSILIHFDIIILIVMLIPTIFITWFNKGYQKKDMEIQKESVCMNRFFMYYYGLVRDFSPGKDIRLFRLHELLLKRNKECDERIFNFRSRSTRLKRNFEGMSAILEAFRSAFAYGYIGVKTLMLNIGIGNFTMYIGAAATFSSSMANLFNNIIRLRQDCRYLEEYVKLEEMPLETYKSGNIEDIDIAKISLEFRQVSFRYPGTNNDVLKDVSFKLKQGESLSIVGKNGAGKTTIIKLLSRLFQPTGGKILINDVDIQLIEAEVYRKLLSVVFQDFKIFEFSIEENIAAGEMVVKSRLDSVLKSAGIMDKIKLLPNGTKTFVGKQFDEKGTEFSGGELQKIAIARALYKDSPIIVLDEPTAALDPYAEEEVYERFHELTGGRTTVYISHRLSSCKFCNRIIFLSDGKIIEDGNHDELIRLNGMYAEMFQIQASQYQL